MSMNAHVLSGTVLLACVGAVSAWSQQAPPPPPPPATPEVASRTPAAPDAPARPAPPPAPRATATGGAPQPFTSRGPIRSWNYGPDGDVNGFTLDRNILVMLPPDAGATLVNAAKLGSRVNVTGSSRIGLNVQTVVDAQMLAVNGQTIAVGRTPEAPPAPAGPAARENRSIAPPPPSPPAAVGRPTPPPPPQS